MSKHYSVYSNIQAGDVGDKSDYGAHRTSFSSIFAFTDEKHLAVLIPALLLTTIAGAIKPAITIFLGLIFDELANFGSGSIAGDELLKGVSTWCIALTGLGVATMLVNGGFFYLWLVFGEMQARSVRYKSFLSMMEKEMEWYDLRAEGIGSLLVRIQTQIRELQIATSQPLGFFLEDTVAALAALGIAFYYSWNLTLVILAFVPLTVILLAVLTRKLQPAIETQKRDLSEASKYSNTAIKEVDTVKIFNGQDQEIWQYTFTIKKAAESYMIQANANSLQMGITRFMTTAMFVVGFWYGIVLVRQGFSPGSVLTTFYSCLIATQAAEALLPQWLVLSKGISAGQTLRDILLQLEHGRWVFKMTGTLKPIACRGDVKVSKLTFSYPANPSQRAIENASFFFPAGETTFVVGRSGSGKSTLGNLLMNFYKPSSGDLSVDGQSIQVLDLEWLRSNICFAQQESVMFNESMFRNIAFGRRPHFLVTEYEVKMASQTAMLQQTISDLPEGLHTIIGKGGNTLSGGQKQRVAIARARLHDAPVLILDEATSALDHISRSLVMEAIREWRRGKTTVVITHNISEIKDGDYVYVLDGGKVVQEGYRQQLLEDDKGSFASFSSGNYDDDKDPFPDKWAISSAMDSMNLNVRKRSIAGSCVTNDSEDDWLQINYHTSRLHRASQFLELNEKPSETGRVNNLRVSRGIGIGSVYANTLHVEHAVGPGNIQSFSRPFNTTILKPLPTLPSLREPRRSCHSNRSILDNESVDLELLDGRGKSTREIRSQTAGLRRRSYSANNMDLDAKIVTYLNRGRVSQHGHIKAHRTPSNHQREATLSQILGTLWPNLLVADRITLILGFANAFISATATPAFSYVLARLLGTFSLTSGQTGAAETWALAILVIAVADGISSYYMHYFLEYCGQTWVDTLRVEALRRILAQPKAWFDKPKNNPGRLNECLDRNAEEMRNIIGRFVGYVFLAGCMMSIAIVWAFIVCWKLTLVGLASGPCMYAFTRAFEVVSGNWEKKLNEISDTAGDIFAETFSNIKVVRALTLEGYFMQKHTVAVRKAYNVGMRRAAYTSIFFGLSDSTNSFVTALILYYGAVIAASGDWSIGSILQVITLLLFSSGNANSVIAFIPQISSSRSTATQMLRLANMPKTASYESKGTTHLATPLPIQFNSLSFTYPTQPNFRILHGISMTIEPGTCTAIVGPSGSGKSTIASLLLGLQPPTEHLHAPQSSLTFSGCSIFTCNISALRSQITLVTQSPVLFPRSIASNIAYGIPTHSSLLTPHNIQSAAKAAGIHDFIVGLPDGYKTRIGEGGRGLSGGQAQRLCIARALARRPKVLVLDEPTSALDGESAGVIRDTIARLTRSDPLNKDLWSRDAANRDKPTNEGMAVILITHSIDMMRVASRIIVLEQGQVVQEGKFEELARRRGSFSKLISRGKWRGGGAH